MEASSQHIKVEVDENLVVAFEEPIKQEPMKSALQVNNTNLEEVGKSEILASVHVLDQIMIHLISTA